LLPDRGTLKDDLRAALLVIEKDALQRVNYKMRFRLWSYENLSNIPCGGEPEDWMCDGRFRRALTGMAARRWLQEDHRLWWKADDMEHTGLLFTADPRTGIEWDRARIADRTVNDGIYLSETADCAERLQGTFRAHFRKIGRAASHLKASGDKLKKMGDADLLRLLGVGTKSNKTQRP